MLDDFCLTEHKVSVDVMGVPYFSMENGDFSRDPEKAFTHYTKSVALRVQADLYQSMPGMIVDIIETN